MQRLLMFSLFMTVVATSFSLYATGELRTPLSLWYPFQLHYPLSPDDIVDAHGDFVPEKPWQVELLGAFYGRTASNAYLTSCCQSGSSVVTFDHTTSCTQPLAALFFGKADFLGEEAFANGVVLNSGYPALSFETISPRFDYNEWGAVVALEAFRTFGADDTWRLNGRVIVPFKTIEMEQSRGCGFEVDASESGTVGFDDVMFQRQERLGAGQVSDEATYAFRFDFLSTLLQRNGMPMVQYPGGTTVTIAGIQASTSLPGLTAVAITPSDLTGAGGNGIGFPQLQPSPTDDRPRFVTWDNQEIDDLLPLPADGSTMVGERYFFLNGVNYGASLGADRTAQSRIFIVPTALSDDGIDPNAAIVYNAVLDVLGGLELDGEGLESATTFFENQCCIDFCQSERITGVGDIDAEMYVGRYTDHGFYNALLGVRLPTGSRNKDPRQLLYQPTGNNGHFEWKLGGEGGWHPLQWFALRADAYFYHVCNANEKKAAPFIGATVINIGPIVNAQVSWNYFVMHTECTFFHPRNNNLGCAIAYEFFNKMRDHVALCTNIATDCLGNTNHLDVCALINHTKRRSNKIRGEAFCRIGYLEIFMGASYVFSGMNCMQESEGHFGFNVYF